MCVLEGWSSRDLYVAARIKGRQAGARRRIPGSGSREPDPAEARIEPTAAITAHAAAVLTAAAIVAADERNHPFQ